MEVRNVSIRKLSLKPTELLSDGSFKLVGTVTLRGILDDALAKALKITKLEGVEAVKSWVVDREEETCAIELVSLSGNEVGVSLPSAALHQWRCTRRDKEVLVSVSARVDSNGHAAMADFMLKHPSWTGILRLEPAQRELGV